MLVVSEIFFWKVRGNSNGAVGVCFCGQLNVIYWWRAVAVNVFNIFTVLNIFDNLNILNTFNVFDILCFCDQLNVNIFPQR